MIDVPALKEKVQEVIDSKSATLNEHRLAEILLEVLGALSKPNVPFIVFDPKYDGPYEPTLLVRDPLPHEDPRIG